MEDNDDLRVMLVIEEREFEDALIEAALNAAVLIQMLKAVKRH